MHKYNGSSIANVETATGKAPENMGFPGNMQGVTRKLTKKDRAQQKRNGIAAPIIVRMSM